MKAIAVIDDGIDAEPFNLKNVIRYAAVNDDLTVTEVKEHQSGRVTHGTLCAAIILRNAPSAELISVKITNNSTEKSTIEKLISALNWCADNGIRLINLSMGTADVRDFEKLKSAVDILTSKGVVIVAAFNNHNVVTCPASLPNVFGVKCDRQGVLHDKSFAFAKANGDIENNVLIANSDFAFTDNKGTTYSAQYFNSFAAPVVTAYVYKLLVQDFNMTFCNIRSGLLKMAYNSFVSDSAEFYIQKKNESEIEIPAILIYYKKDCETFFSKSIFDLFVKDQYIPLLISENADEVKQYNAIPVEYYLESDKITSKTLYLIETIYKPDIMIFSACKTNHTDDDLFDAVLYENKNRVIFKNQNDCTEITDSVKKVYDHILGLYYVK